MSTIPHSPFPIPHWRPRRALTLVEMLVSLACVIILMMAYTQLFSNVGSGINDARSMIELSNRMRSAENMLRNDLAGHTCDMTVWQKPESGAGYFEILEGPLSERDPGLTSYPELVRYPLGDTDDVLMFTTRSQPDTRFVGRNGSASQRIESDVAEVLWFLRPTMQANGTTPTEPPTFTLYRRTLLVTPGSGPAQVLATVYSQGQYDRSMHEDTSGNMVPNTLGDLTKRENRAAHEGLFPYALNPAKLMPFGGRVTGSPAKYVIDASAGNLPYQRYGEDAVLTNVIAFDVQVFDPLVEVRTSGAVAVTPSDPGYASATGPTNQGAYVNLYYDDPLLTGTSTTWFSGIGDPRAGSELQASANPPFDYTRPWLFGVNGNGTSGDKPATYDTWSFHYENDGEDQDPGRDNGAGPDQGTNGLDDDNQNGVDDPGEYETMPPYPYPLRGVKITLRCYDPDSRQVREVSIVESFVPE